MSDTKQTKCPHCGSSFRISDSQLAAKGGSVRCGSCLQVFRADLHLAGATPAPAAVASTSKPKATKGDETWALALMGEDAPPTDSPNPKNEFASDDDFGFSDDDISDFMSGDGLVEAPKGKTPLFDDEINELLQDLDSSLPHHDEKAHHTSDTADESWAKSILSELEAEDKSSQQYSMEVLDGKSKAPPKNQKLANALGLGSGIADEPVSKPAKPAPVDHGLAGNDADILDFLNDDDLGGLGTPASTEPFSKGPFSIDQPLPDVRAPITLKPHREPINWGHLLSWLMLCVVALAMLVAQYVYFNFESLAIRPDIRPYFEQACEQFGCEVPVIPDPSKMRIDDIATRHHPKVEGALVVDAILRNNATFPQPMPVLRLRFSNSQDEIVASRLLRPSEYLQGEARLLRRIPPDTPIRLSLEIENPGDDAINYGIDVVR